MMCSLLYVAQFPSRFANDKPQSKKGVYDKTKKPNQNKVNNYT